MNRETLANEIILCLTPKGCYPFGGYLRDQIAKVDFTDLDLYCPGSSTTSGQIVGTLRNAGFAVMSQGGPKTVAYGGTNRLVKQTFLVEKQRCQISVDLVWTSISWGAKEQEDHPWHAIDADVNALWFNTETNKVEAAPGECLETITKHIQNKTCVVKLGTPLPRRDKLRKKGYRFLNFAEQRAEEKELASLKLEAQVFDFEDGNGPVPAHQHKNGGGWVANTAQVAETVCVGPKARVYGEAQVFEKAWVGDRARVYGVARISGQARVSGQAEVFEKALVSGQAEVFEKARVFSQAQVCDQARVFSQAQVCDQARVSGQAEVFEKALVFGQARVYGQAKVYGQAWVYGEARVSGEARVFDGAQVYGQAQVFGDGKDQLFEGARIQGIQGMIQEIQKKENKMENKTGFMQQLKTEMNKAAYRSTADQAIKAAKTGILAAMKGQGAEESVLGYVTKFLESEMGTAAISEALGHGLPHFPMVGQDPRVQRLSEEFRVAGYSHGFNFIFAMMVQYVMPGIMSALQSLPPAEEQQVTEKDLQELEKAHKARMRVDGESSSTDQTQEAEREVHSEVESSGGNTRRLAAV